MPPSLCGRCNPLEDGGNSICLSNSNCLSSVNNYEMWNGACGLSALILLELDDRTVFVGRLDLCLGLSNLLVNVVVCHNFPS